jgi:hypothetical protein
MSAFENAEHSFPDLEKANPANFFRHKKTSEERVSGEKKVKALRLGSLRSAVHILSRMVGARGLSFGALAGDALRPKFVCASACSQGSRDSRRAFF